MSRYWQDCPNRIGESKVDFNHACLLKPPHSTLIVCFSNWAFGSSSFSFVLGTIVTHPGHASLRSLGDAAWDIAARMCRIGSGEPCFGTRLKAQETFSASSTDLVR